MDIVVPVDGYVAAPAAGILDLAFQIFHGPVELAPVHRVSGIRADAPAGHIDDAPLAAFAAHGEDAVRVAAGDIEITIRIGSQSSQKCFDFVIVKDISHNDRAVRAYRNAVIRAFRHGTFIAKRRTVRCISGSIEAGCGRIICQSTRGIPKSRTSYTGYVGKSARCCTIICADTCVISCCTALLNLFTNMRPGAQSNTLCGIVTNRGRISPHCHRFRRIFSNAYLSSHGNRITCTGFHSRVAFIISTTTGADSNGLHGIIRNFSISANCQTIGVVSDF